MASTVLDALQKQYGSVDYSKWESVRWPFWSKVLYPLAGASRFTFFGSAMGALNMQLTNMPKAGSFGQAHYELRAIRFGWYMPDLKLNQFATLSADVDCFASDLLMGFAQAGYLEFNIGAKNYLQIAKPFLSMPNGTGRIQTFGSGITTTAGNAATATPWVTSANHDIGQFVNDPPILIPAEQSFEIAIGYPSGAIPIISTNVAAATMYMSCMLDGILWRPLQ